MLSYRDALSSSHYPSNQKTPILSTVKLRDLSLIREQNHVQYAVSVPLYRATHVCIISWEMNSKVFTNIMSKTRDTRDTP